MVTYEKRKKGKGEGTRIGTRRKGEVCRVSRPRGSLCGHRKGMILTQVYVHHNTLVVPNTTNTRQELTHVCPWQGTGLQGRGSWSQQGWQEVEVQNTSTYMTQGLRFRVKTWTHSWSLCDLVGFIWQTHRDVRVDSDGSRSLRKRMIWLDSYWFIIRYMTVGVMKIRFLIKF
jgi:hypothetical protein